MRIFDYIRPAARVLRTEGLPLYLVFFVTDRCNARCGHCLFGDGTVFPDVARELSLEEIERAAATMGRLLFFFPRAASLSSGRTSRRSSAYSIARRASGMSRYRRTGA